MAKSGANFAALIYEQASLRPASAAIIANQLTITYAQLRRCVGILAQHLRSQGIKPGQILGVSMAQNPLHLMTILALAQVGAVSLPLHPAVPTERRLLAARRFGADRVISGRSELALAGLGFVGLNGISFEAGSPEDDSLHPTSGDAPMRIVISSGTSGDPKGMVLSHENVTLRSQAIEAGATSSSRLIPMDLNFIAGFRSAMGMLVRGAALVFPQSLTSEHMLRSMVRHKVTHVYCSPVQAKGIVARVGADDGPVCPDVVALRIVGGSMSTELLQTVRAKLSRNVYTNYGSTESGVVTCATPEMLARHPKTVGPVYDWATVEIVDEEDKPLPVGATGQMRIRSDHHVDGYYRDEECSRRHFRNEWFYPGDLGRFDADGLLYVEGRVDERLDIGGMKINPEEIETAMAVHPAVIDAGALAAVDANGYEVLAVALVLNEGSRMAEVRGYARTKLGPLAPIRYFILPALPRTTTGKLKRSKLAKLCSEQVAAE